MLHHNVISNSYITPRLHLHNQSCEQAVDSGRVESNGHQPAYVDQFGFHVPTCCGAIPLDNTWSSDWVVCVCVHVPPADYILCKII